MRLPLRQWGSGPRTAALVHGYTDDAETWWHVGPALAAQGWSVLAPDLRGHGNAPRADAYSLPAFAADLVETLPRGLDLLVGHSLGAAVVNLAAADLAPARTLLVDPPWGLLPEDRNRVPAAVTSEVAAASPMWCATDVQVDVDSNGRLDPAVTTWLTGNPLAGLVLPIPAAGPSVVAVPDKDALVPPYRHDELRSLGFDIVVVAGVGHVVHRDDPQAFLALCAGAPRAKGSACAPRTTAAI